MADLKTKVPVGADISRFLDMARHIAGAARMSTEDRERALYASDFSEITLEHPEAIVRPASTEEVAALVKAARETGVTLVPRGGGMSYTLCYAPARAGTVLLDMQGMNRILELNLDDLRITVEPGVTWKQIHEALLPTGYRIGFMGTMSGIAATVGGGLGNNATGHGRGDINDDLLGIEVVLPDGSVINTGGRATTPDAAVNRGYGPDFTPAFIGDAAAFGIKTKATFRLQRRPRGTAFACFGFRDFNALATALCDAERLGIASSNMAFSAYHHRVFTEQKPTAEERRAMLRAVTESAPTRPRLVRNLMTLALSNNMKFLSKWPYSTFSMIDGFDQQVANRGAALVAKVMQRHGGVRLNESLGIVMRAQPFMPIDKLIVGLDGECSFPSNFTVPLSRAHDALAILDDFFARNEAEMKKYGVTWTRLLLTLKGMFGIEPIIYWKDRMNPLRHSVLSPENQARWGTRAANEETRAYAIDLRKRMVAEMEALKPVHFQIGKFYDYRGAMASPSEWALLEGFKSLVDPDHLMNPGALGLD